MLLWRASRLNSTMYKKGSITMPHEPVELYADPWSGRITDQDCQEWPLEVATSLWQQGKITYCNLAFRRLVFFRFSTRRLREFYHTQLMQGEKKWPEVNLRRSARAGRQLKQAKTLQSSAEN